MTRFLFRAASGAALVSFGYLAGLAQTGDKPGADVHRTVKLENPKVRVVQLDYEPGKPRERSVRLTDQVIVFLDDSKYGRIDPDTAEKTVRERKSGDVIWHDKGEVAPVLTNLGQKTYRTFVVELK